MKIIYTAFFNKLNNNASFKFKGSIEVYFQDNSKFLIGHHKSDLKVFIKPKYSANFLFIPDCSVINSCLLF